MNKTQILITEDERIVAEDIKISLQRLGYTVIGMAHSGEDAIQKAEELCPDIVLMDIVLEGEIDGIEAASTIRSRLNLPVVYLTAYADQKTLERAKVTEPFGYLVKPFEDKDLHTTIEIALYSHKMGIRLRESEERYRSLVENAHDAIFIVTPKGIQYANPAFEKLTGYEKKELCSESFNFWKIIHSEDANKFEEREKAKSKGKDVPSSFDFKIISRNGEMKAVEVNTVILGDDGESKEMGILRDVTNRKKAEQEIQNYQKKLRSLASRLSLTEERERRQIATFVHDEIGQKLALAKIKFGTLSQSLNSDSLDSSAKEIHELIEEIIQDSRMLTFELSPPILYELGLEQSIEWFIEQLKEKHDLQFHFKDDEKTKPLDDDVRVVLFQSIRELLMNAIKHSKAKTVKVHIERLEIKIKVCVEDDGIGFDPSAVQPYSIKTGGFGLFNIRERLEDFEGELNIRSKAGQGTQIILFAPLELKKKASKQK